MKSLTLAIETTLALDDLHPSDHVNATLHQLVACITNPAAKEQIISPDVCMAVRHTCSTAECNLESHWAERITSSRTPQKTAREFPYWDNYRQLTQHEIDLLVGTQQAISNIKRILIIGSGPLPMTALHLAKHLPTAIIDHIDSDQIAAQQGEALLETLGQHTGEYLCVDGAEAKLNHFYDLIVIAALAGETLASKQAIVDNVLPHLTDSGRILVRSAAGIRGLLYPVISASHLRHITLAAEHHPQDETINSVFIYKKELA